MFGGLKRWHQFGCGGAAATFCYCGHSCLLHRCQRHQRSRQEWLQRQEPAPAPYTAVAMERNGGEVVLSGKDITTEHAEQDASWGRQQPWKATKAHATGTKLLRQGTRWCCMSCRLWHFHTGLTSSCQRTCQTHSHPAMLPRHICMGCRLQQERVRVVCVYPVTTVSLVCCSYHPPRTCLRITCVLSATWNSHGRLVMPWPFSTMMSAAAATMSLGVDAMATPTCLMQCHETSQQQHMQGVSSTGQVHSVCGAAKTVKLPTCHGCSVQGQLCTHSDSCRS